MAVNKEQGPSRLAISYNNGVDDNGKTKKKTKSYSGVKSESTNENIYAVAMAINDLQKGTPLKVLRKDEKYIRASIEVKS